MKYDGRWAAVAVAVLAGAVLAFLPAFAAAAPGNSGNGGNSSGGNGNSGGGNGNGQGGGNGGNGGNGGGNGGNGGGNGGNGGGNGGNGGDGGSGGGAGGTSGGSGGSGGSASGGDGGGVGGGGQVSEPVLGNVVGTQNYDAEDLFAYCLTTPNVNAVNAKFIVRPDGKFSFTVHTSLQAKRIIECMEARGFDFPNISVGHATSPQWPGDHGVLGGAMHPTPAHTRPQV